MFFFNVGVVSQVVQSSALPVLKMRKKWDAALAGALVSFQLTVVQMRGSETPNQHRSEIQIRNIEIVSFFGRILAS